VKTQSAFVGNVLRVPGLYALSLNVVLLQPYYYDLAWVPMYHFVVQIGVYSLIPDC